ncbi:hypothetical protein [Streptosporangium sp. NPDC049078]|uniref:hypothetical protein n=1 Tax=Streptosporangium sp. NPDC049078 TaxID=3155767 RepID=UPI003417C11C
MSHSDSLRYHDSEWMLQREMRFNDALVQAARRRPRKTRDRGNQAGMAVQPLTAAEQQAAAEQVRAVAARRRFTPDTVAELLDMLGLTTRQEANR